MVRYIYDRYIHGWGITRIAKALNTDEVPPPRRARGGWAPSAIWEILHRPRYRGMIVWNMYQTVYKGGTTKRVKRQKEDWICREDLNLRIIPPELAHAVDDRIEHNSRVYTNDPETGRLILGRPGYMDCDSKYLLTGFMKCGICGGGLCAITRERKRTGVKFYGCTYHQKRGKAICSNNLEIRQETLDDVILKAINEVLDKQLIEEVIDEAFAQLKGGKTGGVDRFSAIEKELNLLETKIARIIDAIADGQPPEPLVARIKADEDRKKALLGELEILKLQKQKVVFLDEAKVKQDLRKRVKDMKGILSRHPAQARQVLRKLLNGKITCMPKIEGKSKGYQVTGQGNYHSLLPSTLVPILLVSHLIANWNHMLDWLKEVNSLKITTQQAECGNIFH